MSIAQNNPITANDVITALNGKADDPHNHDGRYYTESEVDSILNEVTPPITKPEILAYVNRKIFYVKITNLDTRSVTFYYKINDENVSKTNYEDFATIEPQGNHRFRITANPGDTAYIKGYIGNIKSTQVYNMLLDSGGTG